MKPERMDARAARRAAQKSPNTHLGRALLRARMERGLSIAELARRSGWSRPYINLLENGSRSADAACLIELAEILNIDRLSLLHAAYRDKLALRNELDLPEITNPELVLEYRAARSLQERHFPFHVGTYRLGGVIEEDGSTLLVERRFLDVRPASPNVPVTEIVLQERIVGGETKEYANDTLDITAKPADLQFGVNTFRSGDWLKHRLFPHGEWKRTEHGEDAVSFGYRRRMEKAFDPDPDNYLERFKIASVEQAFLGKATLFLPYVTEHCEIDWALPERYPARSWRLRIWWGVESTDQQDIDPAGVCVGMDIKTTPTTAMVRLDRPLAGYSYSLQWIPANLARRLGWAERGKDAAE